ncbi:FYVE zinc finger-domain-containing protein [Gilbertella persicaria]|uniref:FYVE zinc finger-domain-containing protein n=1 Tax=Gilbertella persicaria TaxID=101096 RepID=UPI00221EB4AD|nr:FYVE zinc finger-domain-containing protein [Gilbertella persicaria]KAI8072202.1 FYVE zinc finger-domain-containing protein [Gilbertella persicaria]
MQAIPSGHLSNTLNHQDYVPVEGILCPICQINCHSLQNLNRHLDIEHNEEESKGALMSWLRNAQKKMQTSLKSGTSPPSNDTKFKPWIEPSFIHSLSLNNSPSFFVSDTDKQSEFVTRDHWQRGTGNDKCHISECREKQVRQHCRKCGKLFCDTHTQYEIKLDRMARHDPQHGVWSKVCVECYTSRPGYRDHQGTTRSKTALFLKQREKTIDCVHLESNRLEKRLEKLARIHQSTDLPKKPPMSHHNSGLLSPSSASLNSLSLDRSDSTSSRDSLGSMLSPKSSFVSNSNSILSMKLKYRDGEQSVTKWEDDRLVKACPLCEIPFTLINRKHHCRLCGKVVCGNSKCSKMIPLFTDMSSDTFDDEPVGDTRACRDCQRYVFRRKLRNEEASKPLPIIQLYNQLSITRKNIEKLLPKFHETILMLEKENITAHTHESFIMAAKIRKSLLDNFTLYDTLAKSIHTLPVRSPCMKRLQANICNAANMYLQQNMLPLQMLPRILKPDHATKKKTSPERKELETQLQAYLEQYELVGGFIREANADRKYDDVKTLKISLEELDLEIKRLKSLLSE